MWSRGLATAIVCALLSTALYLQGSFAGVIMVEPAQRGWINEAEANNGTNAANNYLAGNCGLEDCRLGEYRNFRVPGTVYLFSALQQT